MSEETVPQRVRTIAISRQQGSGGAYVGRAVADRLNLLYIDRQMLRDAAEYLRARDAQEAPEQTAAPWWVGLAQAFPFGSPDYLYVPPSTDVIYEGELFDIQNTLVQEIVGDHPAVIVGRGAAQTLRGRPGVLSIFLHAAKSKRIERVQQVYSVADRRAAERMVHDSDRDRARFVRSIAGVDWTDVRGYDLAVDTAAIGLDTAVDLIVRAVEAQAV